MSNEDDIFKSKYYYKLNDAVEDVSYAIGAKDTFVASSKLVGKAIFNTTLFSGKLGLEIIKKLPEAMAKKAGSKNWIIPYTNVCISNVTEHPSESPVGTDVQQFNADNTDEKVRDYLNKPWILGGLS